MQVTNGRAWHYANLVNSLQRACCIVGLYDDCCLVWKVTHYAAGKVYSLEELGRSPDPAHGV